MAMDIQHLVDRQISRSTALRRAAMSEEDYGRDLSGPETVITVSRQFGSRGRLVATRLSERLDWSLWDKDLVDTIARDAEVSRRVVESFDERTISEIDRLAHSLIGKYEAGGFNYERHLAKVLMSVAKYGYAVILGRGSSFLVPQALNVRLIATEQFRTENIRAELGISREEAKELVNRTDRERAEFIRRAFNKDVSDPLNFDLVLKMDSFDVDEATELILNALELRTKRQAK